MKMGEHHLFTDLERGTKKTGVSEKKERKPRILLGIFIVCAIVLVAVILFCGSGEAGTSSAGTATEAKEYPEGAIREYWSPYERRWFPVCLTRRRADGTYEVKCSRGTFRCTGVPPELIRNYPYPMNSIVLYESTSHKQWIPALITGSNERDGTYTLDCEPNVPVPSDRIRHHYPVSASVEPAASTEDEERPGEEEEQDTASDTTTAAHSNEIDEELEARKQSNFFYQIWKANDLFRYPVDSAKLRRIGPYGHFLDE